MMTTLRLARALLLVCLVSAGLFFVPPAAAATATVTGPVEAVAPGDVSRDYPFYASVVDLRSHGYVEEEFFIEGVGDRYETPALETGRVVEGGQHYKTRFVVRRPASAAQFNGTVVVEWNNVTAGHDLDIDWFQSHDYFIRTGYAWVGVTAQRVGVEALKVWNRARYASLEIPSDDVSYDAFTAVATIIRHPAGIDVLGGLRVERMFATGHSQSASRLAVYVNSIHPLAPVFDAVVVHGGGGRIREDLGTVKVFKLLSETDVISSQAANRQAQTSSFRSWEVAGDSHVDLQFVTYSRQLSTRDGSPTAPSFTPGGRRGAAPPAGVGASGSGGRASTNPGGCDRPPYSQVPFYRVMNAAFDHLVHWVKDGTPPPTAPPIETSAIGPPAVVVRDARGNARGGIRLAAHAVPTGVNTGQNSGPGFCRLDGSHEDFDAATLASLYPTHASYVTEVRRVTEQNVRAGYILKDDANATMAEAEQSGIGR